MITKAKGEVYGRIHQIGNGYYHVSRTHGGRAMRVQVVLGCQEIYGEVELTVAEVNELIEQLTRERDLVTAEHDKVLAEHAQIVSKARLMTWAEALITLRRGISIARKDWPEGRYVVEVGDEVRLNDNSGNSPTLEDKDAADWIAVGS